MRNLLVILLAGGAGERLSPLTRNVAKPAVPFGGIYRIIDFTLSNCINSGLRRIFCLTQYKSLELTRHLREGWNLFAGELGEFIEVIPPMKRIHTDWYLGTADAVYQNIESIEAERPSHVLILSGDHIYKMNYREMLDWHASLPRRRHHRHHPDAAVTGRPLRHRGHRSGDLSHPRIRGEAGARPAVRSRLSTRRWSAPRWASTSSRRRSSLAALRADAEDPASSHDFGRDVIPSLIDSANVVAYDFPRSERQGPPLLARRRHARRLLRRQHGPGQRLPRVQPLRPGLAHPHPHAAGAAGQVRLRAGRPAHGRRHGFHRVARASS